jgi:hypothetical protein
MAGKHRSTVNVMARKYKGIIETPAGPRNCLQVTSKATGKETTGRLLRRDPAPASTHSRPHRPAAGHGQRPAQMS